MAPLLPPRGGAGNAQPAPEGSPQDDATACTFCVGVSVYSKAMADNRLPPRCRGLEFRSQRSPEFLDQLEERAGKIRTDNFTLYGIGLSAYAPKRIARSGRLPVVQGLGLMVLAGPNQDDVMKRLEEHKRVQRELDQDHKDDDRDDIVEDLGDDGDDGSALVEKGPLGRMPKRPTMTPVLPVMTFEEFLGKSVENSKAMGRAMYNFWAKRLDGFGDRYKESCHRIVAQMDKQVRGLPATFGWLKNKAKELEGQLRRGGGDGPGRH